MNNIKRARQQTRPLTPEQARERLAQGSWLSVVRAYHLCEALLTQRLEAVGVKLAEHEVLINLLLEDKLTQQQIADRCFSARSGISMLVSRMEAQGWLTRSADDADRRAKRIGLTPAGRTLARSCHAVQREVVQLMTGESDDAQLEQVMSAMHQAAAALRSALS